MNSSPVHPQSDTGLSAPQMAGVAAGAAGGAMLGQQINGTWGAPVGALVGGAGSALLLHSANTAAAQSVAEAYEQGQRDAKMAQLDHWWGQQQAKPLEKDGQGTGLKSNAVAYPSGTYHGIIYGPRVLPSLDHPEPTR